MTDSSDAPSPRTTLTDTLLPAGDVASRHETVVHASPTLVFQSVKRLDLSRSRVVRLLFRLRGLPASTLSFTGLHRMGFVTLGERPPHEIVLGIAGQFWTMTGNLRRLTAEAFVAFAEPNTAKAIWSFHVEPITGGSRLVTETRVVCSDGRARGRFRAYWIVVAPFSALVRRVALRVIKEEAERLERSQPSGG